MHLGESAGVPKEAAGRDSVAQGESRVGGSPNSQRKIAWRGVGGLRDLVVLGVRGQGFRMIHCDHLEKKLRQKKTTNGSIQVKFQCLECGRSVGDSISRSRVEFPDDLELWDVELLECWYRKGQMASEAETEKWWVGYNAYLRSDEWRQKHLLVLKRDQHLCQSCRLNRATQVHHLTYKHAFNEPLFDLVAVCNECHDLLHQDKEGKL